MEAHEDPNKFFNQSDDYSILSTRVLDMIIKISWTSSGESTERTSCEDTEKNPSKFPIYKRQIRICHVRFVTLNSVIIQLAVLHRISEMVATDATVWIAKLRTRAIFTVRCWAPRVDRRHRRRRRRCLHCNDHAQTPWIEGVKCRCSRRNAVLATITSTSAVSGTVSYVPLSLCGIFALNHLSYYGFVCQHHGMSSADISAVGVSTYLLASCQRLVSMVTSMVWPFSYR